jgi:hypothetical protein
MCSSLLEGCESIHHRVLDADRTAGEYPRECPKRVIVWRWFVSSDQAHEVVSYPEA